MNRSDRAVAVAAAALAGSLLVLGGPPGAHPSGHQPRIDSIAPACARPGDLVTLTGAALAPRGIAISVGGVAAEVTESAGPQARFVVPPGLPLGPTVVVVRPVHGPGAASMPFEICDLAVPAGWVGRWRIVFTYRDAVTNRVIAVDRITASVRPGEPLGLGLLRGAADCTASVTADAAEASCVADLTLDLCTGHATTRLTLERHGDSLTGSGLTEASLAGACPAAGQATVVEVSGVRMSAEPGPVQPGLGVLQRFVRSSAVRFVRARAFAGFAVDRVQAWPDVVEAEGSFQLAAESNGIDPATEDVRIRIGGFAVTLPAGSLSPLPGAPQRGSGFSGTTADGTRLDVTIRPRAQGGFAFTVHARRPGSGQAAGPLLVSLVIGDDAGSASVHPVGAR
jgi:hypothetical protein